MENLPQNIRGFRAYGYFFYSVWFTAGWLCCMGLASFCEVSRSYVERQLNNKLPQYNVSDSLHRLYPIYKLNARFLGPTRVCPP